MTGIRISVGYLYPDLMSGWGGRGNVEAIVRRCRWRNIAVQVTELLPGDRVLPGELDIIMIGGGGEAQQRLVAADLYKVKGAAIREAVADGAAAFAAGGGFELFGRFCQPEHGAELPGIELFDSWTIRRAATDDQRGSAGTRAGRFAGELVLRWDGQVLTGFENHGGCTYLGPAARPLGEVLHGQGNNGDGTEGVVLRGAVGTNLLGASLPANPSLADFLIRAAVGRRHDGAELLPLPDDLETGARYIAIRRAEQAATGRDRALRRPGPRPVLSPAVPRTRRTWLPGRSAQDTGPGIRR